MKKFRITDQNKKKVGLAITIAIVVFLVLVCIVVGIPLLKFAKDPERFRIWVDSLGVWGYLAFIGILVFQIIFAFIPGEPFELLAGYAFGALEGTLLCMAGILIGSLLVFTLTKKFGVKLVELFFSMDKIRSLKFLHNKQRMYFITFLVFFIPGTPKDLLTYFAGLTRIKLHEFLIISMIARIPSLVSSTIGGHFIGQSRYVEAIILFVVTGVVSLIGMKVYSIIVKKHKKGSRDDSDPQLPGTPAG